MTARRYIVRSDFYLGRKFVRSTYALHWLNASPNAQRILLRGRWDVDRMEAYSIENGKLYLQLRARMNGVGIASIETIFEAPGRAAIKREVKTEE